MLGRVSHGASNQRMRSGVFGRCSQTRQFLRVSYISFLDPPSSIGLRSVPETDVRYVMDVRAAFRAHRALQIECYVYQCQEAIKGAPRFSWLGPSS